MGKLKLQKFSVTIIACVGIFRIYTRAKSNFGEQAQQYSTVGRRLLNTARQLLPLFILE